jgi:hypothetical protein
LEIECYLDLSYRTETLSDHSGDTNKGEKEVDKFLVLHLVPDICAQILLTAWLFKCHRRMSFRVFRQFIVYMIAYALFVSNTYLLSDDFGFLSTGKIGGPVSLGYVVLVLSGSLPPGLLVDKFLRRRRIWN